MKIGLVQNDTIHTVFAVYILRIICTFSTCLEFLGDLVNVQKMECITGCTLAFVPFPFEERTRKQYQLLFLTYLDHTYK